MTDSTPSVGVLDDNVGGDRFAVFTPDERYAIGYCLDLVANLVNPLPVSPLAYALSRELNQ